VGCLLELNKVNLAKQKMMQEDKLPYRLSKLAELMQQTHAQCHKIVQSYDIQSQWEEVEEAFAQMFNILTTQLPLIQVKFQGKLTACQNANEALTVENQKLANELQLQKVKIQVQSVRSTTQVENKDLQDENEMLHKQLATLQRGLVVTQSELRTAKTQLEKLNNLDYECAAQISDLGSENLKLKKQVEKLAELLQQLQGGSDVSLNQDGSQTSFTAEGGSRY
jgi:DNA repair exonuclease SbcCD ATPase subunit